MPERNLVLGQSQQGSATRSDLPRQIRLTGLSLLVILIGVSGCSKLRTIDLKEELTPPSQAAFALQQEQRELETANFDSGESARNYLGQKSDPTVQPEARIIGAFERADSPDDPPVKLKATSGLLPPAPSIAAASMDPSTLLAGAIKTRDQAGPAKVKQTAFVDGSGQGRDFAMTNAEADCDHLDLCDCHSKPEPLKLDKVEPIDPAILAAADTPKGEQVSLAEKATRSPAAKSENPTNSLQVNPTKTPDVEVNRLRTMPGSQLDPGDIALKPLRPEAKEARDLTKQTVTDSNATNPIRKVYLPESRAETAPRNSSISPQVTSIDNALQTGSTLADRSLGNIEPRARQTTNQTTQLDGVEVSTVANLNDIQVRELPQADLVISGREKTATKTEGSPDYGSEVQAQQDVELNNFDPDSALTAPPNSRGDQPLDETQMLDVAQTGGADSELNDLEADSLTQSGDQSIIEQPVVPGSPSHRKSDQDEAEPRDGATEQDREPTENGFEIQELGNSFSPDQAVQSIQQSPADFPADDPTLMPGEQELIPRDESSPDGPAVIGQTTTDLAKTTSMPAGEGDHANPGEFSPWDLAQDPASNEGGEQAHDERQVNNDFPVAPTSQSELPPMIEPEQGVGVIPGSLPTVADTVEKSLEGQLDRLISGVKFDLGRADDVATKNGLEVNLRLLELLRRQTNRLDPEGRMINNDQKRSLQHQLDALSAMLLEGERQTINTNSQTLDSLKQAVEELEALADLRVVNGRLCTQIRGFGNFTSFPNSQFAGSQRMLVYCEVENQTSLPMTEVNGVQSFRTRLRGSLVIYNEADQIVQQQEFPVIEDRSHKRRRDFYLYFPVQLEGLAVGDYRMELMVEDIDGSKTATLKPAIQFSVH